MTVVWCLLVCFFLCLFVSVAAMTQTLCTDFDEKFRFFEKKTCIR